MRTTFPLAPCTGELMCCVHVHAFHCLVAGGIIFSVDVTVVLKTDLFNDMMVNASIRPRQDANRKSKARWISLRLLTGDKNIVEPMVRIQLAKSAKFKISF
jgi:hypothetical protein